MAGCVSSLYHPPLWRGLFPEIAAAWNNFLLYVKCYFPSAYLLAGVTFGIMMQLGVHCF